MLPPIDEIMSTFNRCGQEQPTCTNCTKAKKTFPGYRNILDLAFRNESSAVIEKAKAKEKARKIKASEKEQRAPRLSSITRTEATNRASSSNYGDDNEYDLNEILTAPRPRAALAPSIVEQGTSYFISNFVVGVSGPSHGHFNYLKDLCRNGGLDEALSTSMTAVGLAGLANRTKSPQLLGVAHYYLSCALQREIPMPQEVMELRAAVYKQLDLRGPAFRMLAILDKFTYFRSDLRTGKLSDRQQVIAAALALDEELQQIFANVPPGWEVETVQAGENEAPEIVFKVPQCLGYVNRKPSTWTSPPSHSTPPSRTPSPLNNLTPSTPNTISNLFSTLYPDILIPGPSSNPAETGLTPPSFSFYAAGAYFLVWPLYIAAVSRVTSPEDRTFACTTLRRLTSDVGIAQGAALAHFIETSPRMQNSVKGNRKEFGNRVRDSTIGLGRSISDGDKMSKGMIKRAGPLPVYTYTRGINEIEV
ncbi:hypothetical protein BOTCAL_0061g00300 [Botryotinia calthae]|uniref:Transcription factor domain-containing protein n=1 Tax=Botryotinia calthae TaxID=38488 RepID=A0A4Y8DCB5_9HELO|nr:hypothetical protein BOTCAL_0061g00300 [Botryotinia calthae]